MISPVRIHRHTCTHTHTHTHVHSLQIKRKPELFHTNKKKQDMQREKKKKNLYKCTRGWAHYEFFNVPNTSWSAFVPAKICQVNERKSRESSISTSKNLPTKCASHSQGSLKGKKRKVSGCHETLAAMAAATGNGRRQCKGREEKVTKERLGKRVTKFQRKKKKLGCNLACVMLFFFFFCSPHERTTPPPRTKKKRCSTLHVQALKSSGSCPLPPQDCSFGSPEHPFPYSQTYSRAHWNICGGCRRDPHSDTGSP